MQITVSNTLIIKDPTEELKEWCRKELVIPNPDYAKKIRMHLWVGNTPKNLALYELRAGYLVLPYGTLRSIPNKLIEQAELKSGFEDPVSVDYHATVPLYDYQRKAVNELYKAKFGILQSAAGSGKTQMGIALATMYGRRTLWLCHTLDLIKQSKDRAEQYISSDLIGTIKEGKVDLGKGITFATIQTMSRLDLSQYKNYFDVIITDEVHRVSGSPTAITQYEKVLNSLSARHKFGLSATVHRADGMIKATKALVGDVVYRVPDFEIADKIMKVQIKPVYTDVTMSREAINTDGTINYTKLIGYLGNLRERNQLIVDCIEPNHSGLILSERINHLRNIYDLLPNKDEAVMITGSTPGLVRDKALEDMRTGKKKLLLATYSLCKEGLDIPCLDRLYMASPVSDYAVVTQAIGRIARTYKGKSTSICYDFLDQIPYLIRCYKKRISTYKKNGCYFQETN